MSTYCLTIFSSNRPQLHVNVNQPFCPLTKSSSFDLKRYVDGLHLIEFSRNKQNWYLCRTFKGNKLKILPVKSSLVKIYICQLKLMSLIVVSSLCSNFCSTKMPILPTLCITGKLECPKLNVTKHGRLINESPRRSNKASCHFVVKWYLSNHRKYTHN